MALEAQTSAVTPSKCQDKKRRDVAEDLYSARKPVKQEDLNIPQMRVCHNLPNQLYFHFFFFFQIKENWYQRKHTTRSLWEQLLG
jgi:hypothetical protein